jgi:hypothetical protein
MKKMKKTTKEEKILADVDDVIYSLTKKIEKKYNISWEDARDKVNYAIQSLMLSSPEKWLKK